MDRRPIAARNTSWADQIAKRLAKTRITPNGISLWGMAFGILAGAALSYTYAEKWPAFFWFLGAALVALRLGANMFDGMVADIQRSGSKVGSLYNEIPDRVSDAATLIGLGYAAGSSIQLGWAAAVLAVFTAYVRAQAAVSGAPQDFGGPMAKPHRMAIVMVFSLAAAITALFGKTNTPLPMIALALICLGSAITALRRLWKAASALQRMDASP